MKIYLNEELGRIKEGLKKQGDTLDGDLKKKVGDVLSLIDGYKNQMINEQMLKQILQIQELSREIQSDE